jgi:DNA polymerase-3 subunit delta
MSSSSSTSPSSPLCLVCGDDEFAVSARAREIYQKWCAELGGLDHEIIDASVNNSGEALAAIAKLREGLQTLPFFGSGKVIWLRNCNFLGDERAASAGAVTETLAELSEELKEFKWKDVRLLISAGKVDKRKTFFKTLDKIGTVESFAGLSTDDKDWMERASVAAREEVRKQQKDISEEALAELISRVGPNSRQLQNEIEKVCVYLGARKKVEAADVTAVCAQGKAARSFALADALGDRDLPRVLKRLDEELWEIRAKVDRDKSEIGLLYALISKVRAMLLLMEMIREGWVKETSNYPYDFGAFKNQLARIPASGLPEDKKYNPLAMNAYILYKALPQVKKYTRSELIRAMDLLLRCNRRLVSSGLDEALLLQQALVEVMAPSVAA